MEDLLYLVHRIPYPPNKGDKIRSYHLLKHLSQRYRVHLGVFVDDPADWQYEDVLRTLCADVCLVGLNARTARWQSLYGLFTGQPLTLTYYRSTRLQQWVDGVCARLGIRKAVVFSSAMAQFVDTRDEIKRIADFVDVDSDKWRQYAPTKPWPLSWLYGREARKLLAYERQIAARFDATLLVTEEEAALLRQLAPESQARIGALKNGVDYEFFSPQRDYPNPYQPGEEVLVFTGAMDYWPNVDAVTWFAREVFPRLRARNPAWCFYIVGGRPAPAVQRLASQPGVVVTGQVPDVRDYLAHARMAVAPLRIARGVQNKVLEAMAMSKPVVASPQAAEGIHATAGSELLVARDAAEFEQCIAEVMSDGRASMGRAARNLVQRDYDWTGNLRQIEALLEGC